MEKGVVQIDETSIDTIKVLKNLNLTLYVCPSFSIPWDIYVIDLPPYFSIFLSRDFLTKVGGYLSSN